MSKHITDLDIKKIVSLIDEWSDDNKFTWSNLCDFASRRYAINVSRQTLQGYTRIKGAYDTKKKQLRKAPKGKLKVPASLKIAANRIAKLEAENSRLNREQNELLSQFVVWQYNAYANGVSMTKLNAPLPQKKRTNNTK